MAAILIERGAEYYPSFIAWRGKSAKDEFPSTCVSPPARHLPRPLCYGRYGRYGRHWPHQKYAAVPV
ncbi:MAG: hypothetical protein WC989_06845 [Micavibrio sp.]